MYVCVCVFCEFLGFGSGVPEDSLGHNAASCGIQSRTFRGHYVTSKRPELNTQRRGVISHYNETLTA